MRRRFEIHGARKLQRRRYVKERSGARESKETEAEADQLTAQALFEFPDGVFLQSTSPLVRVLTCETDIPTSSPNKARPGHASDTVNACARRADFTPASTGLHRL
jgi:hypothetical protein